MISSRRQFLPCVAAASSSLSDDIQNSMRDSSSMRAIAFEYSLSGYHYDATRSYDLRFRCWFEQDDKHGF
jgi:hypothetical protein